MPVPSAFCTSGEDPAIASASLYAAVSVMRPLMNATAPATIAAASSNTIPIDPIATVKTSFAGVQSIGLPSSAAPQAGHCEAEPGTTRLQRGHSGSVGI